MRTAVCLTLLFLVGIVCSEHVSYEGYKVLRANITTSEQAHLIESKGFDVWSNAITYGSNDIMVREEQTALFDAAGIDYEVIIPDVEKLIQEERASLQNRNAPLADFFTAYHTYDEIIAFIQNITTTFNKLATYVPSIGKTIEGRDVPAVIVKSSKSPSKKMWLSGGQHAREWVSVSTTLYLLSTLLNGYGTNSTITSVVDKTTFVIVPIVNPDGYEFTWSSNRLWRKNRRKNADNTYGVDLNRNWDDHWCESGASKTPSSDTFCGTSAFSEPESKQLAAYCIANKPFDAAIDLHSYSQLILRPYGWKNSYPPAEPRLKQIGDGMAAAIKAVHGMTYTSEHIYDLYLASGSIEDWQLTEAEIPLAYTIELRDTGVHGFQLPANQIIPTGEEIWGAIKYVSDNL